MLNFRRVTTQNRFIPQIDGLRFVAISSVVLFHIYASLNHNGAIPYPAYNALNVGMLSTSGASSFSSRSVGSSSECRLLRHISSARLKINLKQYFLRRLTRLEPPTY